MKTEDGLRRQWILWCPQFSLQCQKFNLGLWAVLAIFCEMEKSSWRDSNCWESNEKLYVAHLSGGSIECISLVYKMGSDSTTTCWDCPQRSSSSSSKLAEWIAQIGAMRYSESGVQNQAAIRLLQYLLPQPGWRAGEQARWDIPSLVCRIRQQYSFDSCNICCLQNAWRDVQNEVYRKKAPIRNSTLVIYF